MMSKYQGGNNFNIRGNSWNKKQLGRLIVYK